LHDALSTQQSAPMPPVTGGSKCQGSKFRVRVVWLWADGRI